MSPETTDDLAVRMRSEFLRLLDQPDRGRTSPGELAVTLRRSIQSVLTGRSEVTSKADLTRILVHLVRDPGETGVILLEDRRAFGAVTWLLFEDASALAVFGNPVSLVCGIPGAQCPDLDAAFGPQPGLTLLAASEAVRQRTGQNDRRPGPANLPGPRPAPDTDILARLRQALAEHLGPGVDPYFDREDYCNWSPEDETRIADTVEMVFVALAPAGARCTFQVNAALEADWSCHILLDRSDTAKGSAPMMLQVIHAAAALDGLHGYRLDHFHGPANRSASYLKRPRVIASGTFDIEDWSRHEILQHRNRLIDVLRTKGVDEDRIETWLGEACDPAQRTA